jgi:hypothetical protein
VEEARHPLVEGPPSGCLVAFAVTVTDASATAAVATTTPVALGHIVLLVKLPDYPTVIYVMCVPLVEDTVSATVALVALRAIVADTSQTYL